MTGLAPRSTHAVRVELGPRSYDALTGVDLLSRLGELAAAALAKPTQGGRTGAPGRAVLVVDDALPAHIATRAAASLRAAGYDVTSVPARAHEDDKSLAALERLLAAVAGAKLERGEPIVALGGGIVGDVAGFAAASYRRGVPVVQCPTTLLAMVDASVGGKTGVNLRTGDGVLKKNMVGAFHQPSLVVADVSTLESLPPRTLRAGLAECIKHGLLAGDWKDPGLFEWIEANVAALMSGDRALLAELVARNVAIKARVVAGDEREEADDAAGGRALLNLGHTFGHALETMPGLEVSTGPGPMHHGEAVALGLVAASRCAQQLGLAPPGLADRVVRVLTAAGLPTSVRGLPPTDTVLAAMAHDKKTLGGRLRLILPVGGWRCKVVADPPAGAVRAAVESIGA
jgi:3-dehydroquinate synthase